jgi:hypothetical protein
MSFGFAGGNGGDNWENTSAGYNPGPCTSPGSIDGRGGVGTNYGSTCAGGGGSYGRGGNGCTTVGIDAIANSGGGAGQMHSTATFTGGIGGSGYCVVYWFE